MIKRIAFDYGRTLFDRDTENFFPEVFDTISYLRKSYDLSIVSYSKPDDAEQRIEKLKLSGLWSMFLGVWFVDRPEAKHDALDELLDTYSLKPEDIAVVDDYVIRGIAWANSKGATSIWFRNGKFSKVEPNEIIGKPDFEITNFGELSRFF